MLRCCASPNFVLLGWLVDSPAMASPPGHSPFRARMKSPCNITVARMLLPSCAFVGLRLILSTIPSPTSALLVISLAVAAR